MFRTLAKNAKACSIASSVAATFPGTSRRSFARVVKVVGRAGIGRDLHIATSRAAPVDQFTAIVWRDFLVS